jgi:hypothetical protein
MLNYGSSKAATLSLLSPATLPGNGKGVKRTGLVGTLQATLNKKSATCTTKVGSLFPFFACPRRCCASVRRLLLLPLWCLSPGIV